MKRLIALLVFTLAAVGSAAAQGTTATLVGRVADPTKAVIPGADVHVRDLATNEIRTAKTNGQGDYTVSDLDPGSYDVVISMKGFKELHQPLIVLQTGQTARFDATLQIGSIDQEVVVTGEVGALNTDTSDKGDVIAPVEIQEMPLDGRNFEDLVFNVAGVSPAEQGGKGTAFVANGSRDDSTNILVDGMNNTSPTTSEAEATPPLDSLQEFKVQTSNYDAEYGRVSGPVVSLVIKKGGNVLHGEAFEFVRNDFFDAGNYFDVPGTKSELRRNQFGTQLDGPVYIPHLYNGHNKTFFLFSEESYREVQGVNSISLVPSLAERVGNFSDSIDTATGGPLSAGGTQIDPTPPGTPLIGDMLPQSLWNPIALELLNYYPLPSVGFNLPGGNNYITNQKTYDYWDNGIVKLDRQIAAHDEASIRFLYRRENSTNPFAGSTIGGWGDITHHEQVIAGVTETHIFNPRLINEFRSGLTRDVENEVSEDAGTNWAALIGIPGTTTVPGLEQFPTLKVTGYATLGDQDTNPLDKTTDNYDTNDVLTWSKGKHTIKFGADMLRIQDFQPVNTGFSGEIQFNGKAKNFENAFLEFLAGTPTTLSLRQGAVNNHLFDANYSGFAQDDYKVSADLTLNLGLRYELETLPYEENGQYANFIPSLTIPNDNGQMGVVLVANNPPGGTVAAIASAGGVPAGSYALASSYGYPKTLVFPNYKRLAPRIGFAWRPSVNDQLVIRAGYGIFYTGSRLQALRTQLAGNFPFSFVYDSNLTVGTASFNNIFLPQNLGTKGGLDGKGYDAHPSSSYLQSWNLTLERELPKGFVVEAAYTGSKGTHLGRDIDINQKVRSYGPNNTIVTNLGPYPSWNTVDFFGFAAYSNDNAGSVTLRKRFEHGLLVRANLTYAKYLDTASSLNSSGDGGYEGAQNSLDPDAEYGRDDSDRRLVFNGNFLYLLPFNRDYYVRGWQFAGSWQIDSGAPFTPQLASPVQSEGVPTRPNRVCSGVLAHPTVNDWFNLACFPQVLATTIAFGDSGRNILDGPKLVTINMSLSRNFRITDKGKLEFRWEVFNVINHPNFMLPNDNVDEATAGAITTAGTPRVMQLGAKYSF